MIKAKVKKLVLKGIVLSLAGLSLLGICSYDRYKSQASVYTTYLSNKVVDNSYPGYIIKFGSTGDNVKRLQERLNQLGFNAGYADGIFGSGTKAAVMSFQQSRNLDVDGLVGQATWKALFSIDNSNSNLYPGYYIMQGSTGEYVVKVQQRLNELGFNAGYTDGIFGSGTKAAVVKFQQSKKLDADGIIGQATWGALFENNEISIPDSPDKEESDNKLPSTSDKDNPTEDSNESIVPSLPEINKPEVNNPEISLPEVNRPALGTTIPGDRNTLVQYSFNFLGCPYVWGATGPDAFDSSSFTAYVYKKVMGINIGRTTYDQIKIGISVKKDELKIGDLVFPHTGHVGIYVGNGKMIHAPGPGDIIKIANVNKFYTARRIIE